jgi:hypothetical protein
MLLIAALAIIIGSELSQQKKPRTEAALLPRYLVSAGRLQALQ